MDLMDYRRKIIANSPHLKSASGSIVSFSDGADLPLKSLNVGIEPVQSGSGDPSPSNVRPISGWSAVKVTRCGKNLCEPTEATYKNENGSWFNGTDIASVKSALNSLPVGVYTISFKFSVLTTVSSATSWGILIHNTQSGYIDGRQTAQHNSGETLTFAKTLTITESNQGKFDHVYMYSGGGNHADVYWYDFQLELGSSATPYEAYTGQSVTVQLGQTVYGGTLNPLTGVLTAYPYYASYNGETLTRRWVSDRDKYVAGTTPTIGAQVVDMSGTGTEIQLTPQQVRSLYGNNTIFADTGNISLEYWAHP